VVSLVGGAVDITLPIVSLEGFALLAKYDRLKLRMDSVPTDEEMSRHLNLTLSLLVDGFLSDLEVFQSFGLENLYSQRVLGLEQWKRFKQIQLANQISALENAFHTADAKVDTRGHDTNISFDKLSHAVATRDKDIVSDGHRSDYLQSKTVRFSQTNQIDDSFRSIRSDPTIS
jgi:hypothetical protein